MATINALDDAQSTADVERLIEAKYPELPHEDFLTLAAWADHDGRKEEAEFFAEAQRKWNELFSRYLASCKDA